MNSWRIALALLLASACAPYQRGAVFETPEGSRSFECLDVHLGPTFDRGRDWVVLRYNLGNFCRHATPVDLSAVRVRAEMGEESARLPAYDPREELHPAQLDGRMQAEERIAYEIPPNLVGQRLHVCVILRDVAPSQEQIPDYCFDWEAE